MLVKLASSVRRFGTTVEDLGEVTATARAAGLDVVGFSVHPPVVGSDDEHLDDVSAWLDVLDPDDEVWVSHLSPGAYQDLRDAWPGRRFRIRVGTRAVARRQGARCTSTPTCSTSDRCGPASTPATASTSCRSTAAS